MRCGLSSTTSCSFSLYRGRVFVGFGPFKRRSSQNMVSFFSSELLFLDGKSRNLFSIDYIGNLLAIWHGMRASLLDTTQCDEILIIPVSNFKSEVFYFCETIEMDEMWCGMWSDVFEQWSLLFLNYYSSFWCVFFAFLANIWDVQSSIHANGFVMSVLSVYCRFFPFFREK